MMRLPVLIAAFVLLTSVPARAASGSCSAESLFASSMGGTWLGGCDGLVACPSTATSCVVQATGEVRGVGVVGVKVVVDGLERGRCAYGPEICNASALVGIPSGDRVPVGCRFVDGAAIDVVLSCEWTIRT